MQIDSGYSTTNIFDLSEITRDEKRRTFSVIERQTTASGDSVDISDEARKLYSEMIHKYDTASRNPGQESEGDSGAGAGMEGAPQELGGGSASSSGDDVESIKQQIQALKSQLMALASQVGAGGAGQNAAMGKMNALQSQIAALEAQLNAMSQAG